MALPTGRRGQILATGLTVLACALLWFGAIVPWLAWNSDLADRRFIREGLADRMGNLADSLPGLQRELAASATSGPPVRAVIDGGTDAIAAAFLQERIQEIGRKAGVTLTSSEALPVEASGQYRRIGLRVVVQGDWQGLTRFLAEIDQASPRMLVDDLQVQRGAVLIGANARLSAGLAVFGFRAAAG